MTYPSADEQLARVEADLPRLRENVRRKEQEARYARQQLEVAKAMIAALQGKQRRRRRAA